MQTKTKISTKTLLLISVTVLVIAGGIIAYYGYVLSEQTGANGQILSSVGKHKTLVILLDYLSDSDIPTPLEEENSSKLTREEIFNIFFGKGLSVNNYFKEASYNKAWLKGEVYGWYPILRVPVHDTGDVDLEATLNDAITTADRDVDFRKYDNSRIVVYNLLPNSDQIGAASYASVETREISTKEGQIQASIVWINVKTSRIEKGLLYGLIAHELGHNLGLYHSWGYDCSKKAREITGGQCLLTESENEYDLMSCHGGGTFGHLNAAYKDKVGWFDDSDIISVERSGVFTIGLLETDSIYPEAIKIRINSLPLLSHVAGDFYYYIEYRRPVGFDKGLEIYDLDGVLINGALNSYDGLNDIVALLDVNPDVSEYDRTFTNKNRILHIGEKFEDKENNLTITVLSIDDKKATLKIKMF